MLTPTIILCVAFTRMVRFVVNILIILHFRLIRIVFGPPAQQCRLCLAEFSKLKARNLTAIHCNLYTCPANDDLKVKPVKARSF